MNERERSAAYPRQLVVRGRCTCIRSLRATDIPPLTRLVHAAVHRLGCSHYSAEQVAAWSPAPVDPNMLEQRLGDGRDVFVAADDQDEPLAFIDLEPDGHIDLFFCRPDVAGTGIGSALFDHLERVAAVRGIVRLHIEASEVARDFFHRRGFAVLRRQEFELNGVAIHNYVMAKSLQGTAGRAPDDLSPSSIRR